MPLSAEYLPMAVCVSLGVEDTRPCLCNHGGMGGGDSLQQTFLMLHRRKGGDTYVHAISNKKGGREGGRIVQSE